MATDDIIRLIQSNKSNTVFWTVFATVISGVLVFMISQLLISTIINPIKEFEKIKSNISFHLIYYANIYSNTLYNNVKMMNKYIEASNESRKLASQIGSFSVKNRFVKFFIGINKTELKEVEKDLIGLSNNVGGMNGISPSETFNFISECKKDIVYLLKLKI